MHIPHVCIVHLITNLCDRSAVAADQVEIALRTKYHKIAFDLRELKEAFCIYIKYVAPIFFRFRDAPGCAHFFVPLRNMEISERNIRACAQPPYIQFLANRRATASPKRVRFGQCVFHETR